MLALITKLGAIIVALGTNENEETFISLLPVEDPEHDLWFDIHFRFIFNFLFYFFHLFLIYALVVFFSQKCVQV